MPTSKKWGFFQIPRSRGNHLISKLDAAWAFVRSSGLSNRLKQACFHRKTMYTPGMLQHDRFNVFPASPARLACVSRTDTCRDNVINTYNVISIMWKFIICRWITHTIDVCFITCCTTTYVTNAISVIPYAAQSHAKIEWLWTTCRVITHTIDVQKRTCEHQIPLESFFNSPTRDVKSSIDHTDHMLVHIEISTYASQSHRMVIRHMPGANTESCAKPEHMLESNDFNVDLRQMVGENGRTEPYNEGKCWLQP